MDHGTDADCMRVAALIATIGLMAHIIGYIITALIK